MHKEDPAKVGFKGFLHQVQRLQTIPRLELPCKGQKESLDSNVGAKRHWRMRLAL